MAQTWDDLGFPVIELSPRAFASPEAAVRFLVEELARTGRLREEDAPEVVRQILRRERAGSTAFGRGFALPHAKSDVVDGVLGVVGTSSDGVAWPNLIDRTPIRVVCLLIAPAAKPSELLRALEDVSKRLRGDK